MTAAQVPGDNPEFPQQIKVNFRPERPAAPTTDATSKFMKSFREAVARTLQGLGGAVTNFREKLTTAEQTKLPETKTKSDQLIEALKAKRVNKDDQHPGENLVQKIDLIFNLGKIIQDLNALWPEDLELWEKFVDYLHTTLYKPTIPNAEEIEVLSQIAYSKNDRDTFKTKLLEFFERNS